MSGDELEPVEGEIVKPPPLPGQEQAGDVIEGGFVVEQPSPPVGSVTIGVPGRGFVLLEPSGYMTAYNADGSLAGELRRGPGGRLELWTKPTEHSAGLMPAPIDCPLTDQHGDQVCPVCGVVRD